MSMMKMIKKGHYLEITPKHLHGQEQRLCVKAGVQQRGPAEMGGVGNCKCHMGSYISALGGLQEGLWHKGQAYKQMRFREVTSAQRTRGIGVKQQQKRGSSAQRNEQLGWIFLWSSFPVEKPASLFSLAHSTTHIAHHPWAKQQTTVCNFSLQNLN